MSITLNGDKPRKPARSRQALTPQQRRFLAELMRNGGAKSAAYRVAYPECSGGAQVIASKANRLCNVPEIRAALADIRRREDEAVQIAAGRYIADRARLVDRLLHMGMTDVDQLCDVLPVVDEQGAIVGRQLVVKDLGEIEPKARASIAEIRQTREGIIVKLADRRACLMDVARLMGWVTDEPLESKRLVTLKIER